MEYMYIYALLVIKIYIYIYMYIYIYYTDEILTTFLGLAKMWVTGGVNGDPPCSPRGC